jgi:citrate lyase beta subunit
VATRSSGVDADAERVALGVALEQTRLQEKEPRALADQLEHLSGALGAPGIAELVRERGGEDLSGALRAKVEALRAISEERAVPRGTPEETEALDVLDGLVVSLLRRARRAAVAAARATGNRAILTPFTLNLLY